LLIGRGQTHVSKGGHVMKRSGFIPVVLILLSLSALAASAEGVAVTVYSSDLALVKDVRTISIDKGLNDVRFPNVAEMIDPTSVHFKVIDGPAAVVWEQNYRFDLASSSKILEKYLEKDIDAVTEDADLFSGRLVSFDDAAVVLDEGRGAGPIVTLNREKLTYVRFPSLPAGLISRPTLVWKIGAEKGGDRTVEVTYMTSSVNWHAEYVGVAGADDKTLDLAAWVSIDNRSGATYENAKLDLVAGEVHRAAPAYREKADMMRTETMAGMAAPEFAQEALFEYYLYKLDTPATIADREIKQLSFFPSTKVAVEKVLEFDSTLSENVRVLMEFPNSEQAGLGRPLPAGKVRMYKEDSQGDLQFIGEDAINHTPKDEDVKLTLGDAFDVKTERKMLDTRKITNRVHEEDYEISVRNHKKEDVVVRVVEHPYGFWSITKSSYEYEKKEASRVEFLIPAKTDGESVLTYTIRYEY
jgi:hypothetical protein